MKVKFRIDWKKALVFLLVSAGLYYLTRSFTMTLGILLLLIVADYLLADWDDTRKRKREWREFERQLRDENARLQQYGGNKHARQAPGGRKPQGGKECP